VGWRGLDRSAAVVQSAQPHPTGDTHHQGGHTGVLVTRIEQRELDTSTRWLRDSCRHAVGGPLIRWFTWPISLLLSVGYGA
jgi:hypothetical protein